MTTDAYLALAGYITGFTFGGLVAGYLANKLARKIIPHPIRLKGPTNAMPYNGYANYATWVTNLWIDNDEYHQKAVGRLVATTWSPTLKNKSEVADNIKDYVSEEFIDPFTLEAGLHSDLMSWAFGMVDWFELAGYWIDDLPQLDLDDGSS